MYSKPRENTLHRLLGVIYFVGGSDKGLQNKGGRRTEVRIQIRYKPYMTFKMYVTDLIAVTPVNMKTMHQ